MSDPQSQRRQQHWWGSDRPVPSLSFPPPRLLAVFAIVVLFLWLQSNYATDPVKSQAQRADIGLRMLMMALPVLLLFAARYTLMARGRAAAAAEGSGGSPWRVAFLVAVVVVLVLYQAGFSRV